MKIFISLIAILLFFVAANAQGVIVTDDNTYTGDNSAMLDIKSTTKGFLVPRLTEEQKNNISNPAKGLLIFQPDGSFGMYYNAGTPSSPVWKQIATNPIVTLEDADGDTKIQIEKSADEDKIRFDVGGSEVMIIDNDGNIGIGTSTPEAPMHIVRVTLAGHTVSDVGIVRRTTSGTPSNGIGANVVYEIEAIDGLVDALNYEITLSDVTSGSESSSVNFNSLSGGSTWNPISLDGKNKIVNLGGDGGKVGIGTSTPTAPLHVEGDYPSTNTAEPIGEFCRTTSGTPSSGIGVKMWTAIEGIGGVVDALDVEITLSDVTSGSESSSVNFNTLSGGSTWNPISLDGENKQVNLGGDGGKVLIAPTGTTQAAKVHIEENSGTYPTLRVDATGSDQGEAAYFRATGTYATCLYAYSAHNTGVLGVGDGSTSRGVSGVSTQISGANFGVYGESKSMYGTGVYGIASRNVGANCGVHGKSASFYGTGVKGEVTATTEVSYGGKFSSASTSGYGVFCETTATTGSTFGVSARTHSTGGTAVRGYASAGTGATIGIHGEVDSPDGLAGRFDGNVYITDKLGLCSSSPDTKLDVNGVVTIQEVSSTPSNPDADGETRVYIKDNKYIVQFNDGGTIKYRYMDLTSTDANWTYTTTAP